MQQCVRRPLLRFSIVRALVLTAALVCAAVPSSAVADEARTLALGRHLARECTSCHRIDGVDNGIPSITGWAASDFVTTMGFYRTGARPNQAMVSVAQSLSDDEVKALAAYYGSLPKAPRRSR